MSGFKGMIAGAAQKISSGTWDDIAAKQAKGQDRNWWHSRLLVAYVQSKISGEPEVGVVGALREKLNGQPLKRGISIACGHGAKELKLLKAGLVEQFELYEISQARVDQGRQNAENLGLSDRAKFHCADAFAEPLKGFDLVYWDHALHHMLDVKKAVGWSIEALNPKGLLLVNDYIGPTRLQWTRREVDFAREFLAEAETLLGYPLQEIKYKNPLSRFKMMLKDPSEAPQSDLIMSACKELCSGFSPEPVGCAMINICGPSIASGVPEDGPAHELLIDWDKKAQSQGMSHFAFGIWQKP